MVHPKLPDFYPCYSRWYYCPSRYMARCMLPFYHLKQLPITLPLKPLHDIDVRGGPIITPISGLTFSKLQHEKLNGYTSHIVIPTNQVSEDVVHSCCRLISIFLAPHTSIIKDQLDIMQNCQSLSLGYYGPGYPEDHGK